jgi:predicted nucleotidyltransferase
MNATLQKIIDYTIRVTEPNRIILFGSMVNGKITPYSDVDLLIISEHTHIKSDVSKMIKTFCNEFSLKADVLIYSEKELEQEKQKAYSFLGAICKDGKLVYDATKKADSYPAQS